MVVTRLKLLGLTVIAGAAMVALTAVPNARAAVIDSSVSIPLTGDEVRVGQNDVASGIEMQNITAAPLTINTMVLTASCGNASSDPCSMFDAGVLSLSPTGSGAAGTACAGTVFTFGAPNPGNGGQTLTPGSLTLAATDGMFGGGDSCAIGFTVDVLRLPTFDSEGALVPGLQTRQFLRLDGSSFSNGGGGFVTVNPAPPIPATPPGSSPKSPCDGLTGKALKKCLCKQKKGRAKRKCLKRLKGRKP